MRAASYTGGVNMKLPSIKKKIFKSLQLRILLVILLFLYIPTAVLSNYNFNQMEIVLQEKISSLTLRNLEQIGYKIDYIVEDIMKISSMVSSNSVIISKLSGYKRKNIGEFPVKNPLYLGAEDVIKISEVQKQIYYVKNNFFNYNMHVILFGADGNMYSSLDAVYDEWEFKLKYFDQYKNQDWYHVLESGEKKGLWISPFTYELEGETDVAKHYISLARIMKDIYSQDILGIIMVNFSEDNFRKYLGSDSGTVVALLNSDREIIFSSDSDHAGTKLPVQEAYSGIPHKGRGYITREINHVKYLLNYYSMDRIGWSLVSVIPYAEVMKEIASMKMKTSTINVIIFSCFFVIASALIIYMLNPMRDLINKIRTMKIGEHSIGLKKVQYSDDVSGIVNSFEYLMQRVEELVGTAIKEQKYENDLKYEALRAQINPHFLFNTLNTIKWSALMSGAENVSKMISALGRLLEVSMNKGDDEIPLREELELAGSYVYIQNIRYNNKFKLTYDPDARVSRLKILKLILQPIVENSIFHGLKNKTGTGEISISAFVRDDKLVVSVKDNGVGISRDKIEHIFEAEHEFAGHKFSRIGLINIHERLGIKYGREYGLKIESEEGKGTTVLIILPVID